MDHGHQVEAETLLRSEQKGHVVQGKNSGWDTKGEGEKAPFLRHEPVRLTPGWEGANLPNDTLNLKGVTMDLAPPQDRYHLIFMTLVLHGLGSLMGWNMFITGKDYFVSYKLANAPALSNQFLVYIGYASQFPNFIFNWVNVFVEIRGQLTTRIVWSLVCEVVIFVVTVALAMVNSSDWPTAFFWITIITVLILSSANAIFQNSVYGVAARLPSRYTGAVVLGNNVCGTLVVFLSWITDVIGGDVRTAAIYYFITGMFVLLVCFDTYFALPLNRFYRYHDTLQQRTLRVNPALAATATVAGQQPTTRTPYLLILRQIWVQIYNVFITFFITLAVFPAVHSDIRPITPGFLGDNFVRLTCFLTFNVMAMIGNITASLWSYPSRKYLSIFTSLRILFVVFFLLCNYQPMSAPRTMGVLIKSDALYWIGAFLFAWSHGHASSLAMMFVSSNVAPEHSAKAGMLGAATLATGILTGIMFSGVSASIVTWSAWSGM